MNTPLKNLTLLGLLLSLSFFLNAQTNSVSGTVQRHNYSPVEGVTLHAHFGNDSLSVISDANGEFTFSAIPSGSEVTFSYEGTFDLNEGVTILDVFVSQLHLLQIGPLFPLQAFQADINDYQGVTGFDLVIMKQLDLYFDQTIFTNNSWILMPSDVELDSTAFQIFDVPPLTFTYVIDNDLTDFDFFALKKGDPAMDTDHDNPPADAPNVVFNLSPKTFLVGDTVEYKITVENFENILGWQNTLQWDDQVLEFIDATGYYLNLESLPNITGNLFPFILSTYNVTGQTVPDNEVLLTLTFKALQTSNTPIALSYADTLTQAQIVWSEDNLNLFILDGTYTNVQKHSISGKVQRHNYSPVEGISLSAIINNSYTLTTISDANGEYSFDLIPDGSLINYEYEGDFTIGDCYSVLDLVELRGHILGFNNLSPIQYFEGDINSSVPLPGTNGVTTIDVIFLTQNILGMATLNETPWILLPVDTAANQPSGLPFSNPPNPINEHWTNVDYFAAKKGILQ